MKILITGSSGMLGHEISGVLSKNGIKTVGIDITGPDTRYPVSDTFYLVNISDAGQVKTVFNKERPDAVIHAAAWADVDGCQIDPLKAHKINVDGTVNIVEAAVKNSAKLVFISTDFVFDGKSSSPYTELDECGPLGEYAKTKWEGEKVVRDFLKNHAIVRTSWLFGPGGKNFVDTIIAKARENRTLHVVRDQTGSPTYTKDLANGILKLIEQGINGQETYHFCNWGQCSWFEFAVKIKSLVPEMKDVVIEPVSSLDLGRPAPRPAFSVMNTDKFRKYTGMSLRKWEEALGEYLLGN